VRAVQAKRDAFLELEALARAGDNEQRMKIARHVGLVGAALESTSTFAQDRLAAEVQVSAILLVAQLARTSYCRTLLLARGVLKRLADAADGCGRAHERAVLTAVARALVLLAEDGPLQSMARTVPSSSSVQALARCRAILVKSRFPSVQDILSGGSGSLLGPGASGRGAGPLTPTVHLSVTTVKKPPQGGGAAFAGGRGEAYTALRAPSTTPGLRAFGQAPPHPPSGGGGQLDKTSHLTSIVSRLDSRMLAERSGSGTPRSAGAFAAAAPAAGTPGGAAPTIFQTFSTPSGAYLPEQRAPSRVQWRDATPLPPPARGSAAVAEGWLPGGAAGLSPPGSAGEDVIKIKAFMTWMGHAAHIHRQRRLLARSRRRLHNRIKQRLQRDAFHCWQVAVSGKVIAAQERRSTDSGELFESNLGSLAAENADLRKALLSCQQDSEEAHRHGEVAQSQLQYILSKVADLGEKLSEIEGGGGALIAACGILEDVLKHHTTEATRQTYLIANKALGSERTGAPEGAGPSSGLSSWFATPAGNE